MSVFLGVIEVFCYSGIAFGFPFIEFIMKEDGIFYDEQCYSRERVPNVINPFIHRCAIIR